MEKTLNKYIKQITGCDRVGDAVLIQDLWSNYGKLLRVNLSGGRYPSVIVKQINTPDLHLIPDHPRGWQTHRSNERKLKSYLIEKHWYVHYAEETDEFCRVPQLLGETDVEGGMVLLMEDLDQAGYTEKKEQVNRKEIESCLRWLAAFHARFMFHATEGLWEKGSYWHLETRPDEWQRMRDSGLKAKAAIIDDRLHNCQFKTIIHGDAKLANFCFDKNGNSVAAVDFQYVGGGCGIKDVAYFLSSCLTSDELFQSDKVLLEVYYGCLTEHLKKRDLGIDFQQVIEELEILYKYAWADFYRFLDGWSPGHWKMHEYSKSMRDKCIADIEKDK